MHGCMCLDEAVLHCFPYMLQDEWGHTPLMCACREGYINAAKVLVENGAIVDLLCEVTATIIKLGY